MVDLTKEMSELSTEFDGKIYAVTTWFNMEENRTAYTVKYTGHVDGFSGLQDCSSSEQQYINKYGQELATRYAQIYDENIDWLTPFLKKD